MIFTGLVKADLHLDGGLEMDFDKACKRKHKQKYNSLKHFTIFNDYLVNDFWYELGGVGAVRVLVR